MSSRAVSLEAGSAVSSPDLKISLKVGWKKPQNRPQTGLEKLLQNRQNLLNSFSHGREVSGRETIRYYKQLSAYTGKWEYCISNVVRINHEVLYIRTQCGSHAAILISVGVNGAMNKELVAF